MAVKQLLIRLFIILIFASGLGSCVNLKYVGEFSAASVKNIEQFGQLGYNFSQNCHDKCQAEAVMDLELSTVPCDCSLSEEADSVTAIIYNAAKDYLDGLARLSDNQLTMYKTDAWTKALTKGSFGSVRIEDNEADAYSRLTKLLITAFTEEYRARSIKKYVTEANGPFCILLDALSFTLSQNLYGTLNTRAERTKGIYSYLATDPSLSAYEKKKAVEEYYLEIARLEDMRKDLVTYSKALMKIKMGHMKLTKNIDDMNKDEVIRQIRIYSSDLRSILSDFRQSVK